jgi:hypothetical protein
VQRCCPELRVALVTPRLTVLVDCADFLSGRENNFPCHFPAAEFARCRLVLIRTHISKMIIEFRIPIPLSVDEFLRGQLHMVCRQHRAVPIARGRSRQHSVQVPIHCWGADDGDLQPPLHLCLRVCVGVSSVRFVLCYLAPV